MSTPCYPMDGTSYTGDTTYLPCNLTAIDNGAHSACCAFNDLCLTNGLCRNPENDAEGLNHYWQVGCTDPTFQDDACPKYCEIPASSELPRNKNHFILKCLGPNVPWCCTPNDLTIVPRIMTDCCSIPSLTFTAADPVAYATARLPEVPRSSPGSGSVTAFHSSVSAPTSLSSTSDGDPTSSPSGTPVATPLDAASSTGGSSGLSTGAKIGIGVGVALGVFLLLLVGAAVWWRRREAAKREMEQGGQGHEGGHGYEGRDVAELDGYAAQQRIPKAPGELDAGPPPLGCEREKRGALRGLL